MHAALAADTAVIYMGVGQAPSLSAALMAAGKSSSTPVAVVENASLTNFSYVVGTLEELPRLAALGSGGPALILIGEVFREQATSQDQVSERTSVRA